MIRERKKIPENAPQRIPEIVRIVSQDKDIAALYVFGTAAHNELKPLSDLDFGILLSSKLDRKAVISKHLEMIGKFNDFFHTDEIDLVLMNNAPLNISYYIIRQGKLLFCAKKKEVSNFQEHLLKLYLDFVHFRNAFDQQFLTGIGSS